MTRFYLSLLFSYDSYFVVLPREPSPRRGRVCSLQCNRWLVRSLTTNNHTLLPHLRLCSLFVASYDSQGLRWKYSGGGLELHCIEIALQTTDPSSPQRGLLRKNNKVIVKRKKKRKIKSGHGAQREARYRDELVDWLSATRRTPTPRVLEVRSEVEWSEKCFYSEKDNSKLI
jgi:hypothetical protein